MILKKQLSRALSAVLCLMLVVSLIPAQAFAAEEVREEEGILTEAPASTEGLTAVDISAEDEPIVLSETEDEIELYADTEYTKKFDAGDLMNQGFNSLSFTVTTTDEKGAGLETATGSIVMEETGEEYDALLARLIESGIAVDARSSYMFRLDCKDADGNPIDLDDTKTTMAVSCDWMTMTGAPFTVYIYDGETLVKETSGTHDVTDYSDFGLDGYFGGSDAFTVNGDNVIVLYVQVLKEHEPLDPGTYSISANMTVLGKNNAVIPGTQVFISSEEIPPTTLEKNNAELVVAEDGTMTLTLKGFNIIFTLQDVESGADVIVKEKVLDEGFKTRFLAEEPGEASETMLANLKDDSRIKGLVLELKNYNGFYRFTNCLEYALPISSYMNMQIDLLVDFDSAIPGYSRPGEGEKEYSKDFTDQATGITVHVDTTEAFGEKLEKATLKVDKVTSGETIYRMERLYMGDTYQLYNFRLLDESGKEIVMEGNSQAKIDNWNVGQWMTPVVHQFEEKDAPVIASNLSGDKVSFTLRHLGEVAVVGQLTRKSAGGYFPKENGGAIKTGGVTSASSDGSFSMSMYCLYGSGNYNGYLLLGDNYLGNINGLTAKKEETTNGTKYMMGFQDENIAYANSFGNNTRVEVELPYDASKPYYYFVMTDGTDTYIRQYTNTWRHGDKVVFNLINSLELDDMLGKEYVIADGENVYGKAWTNTMLTAMYNGHIGRTPSASNKVAYILQSDKKLAGTPFEHKSGKIGYSAQKVSPYWIYDANTFLSGVTSAKHAGEHTVTVTPKAGYTWIDGTTEPKTMSWSIEKDNLYVYYAGETIHPSDTPKLGVTFGGWEGDENEETAAGFVMPKVTAPENLTVGEYELTPEGGAADDYILNYRSRKLIVVPEDIKIIDKPTATDYIVDGEEHTGVPEGEGYTLSGTVKESKSCINNNARFTGYTAIATPEDGYVWSDGTTGPASVTWWIYERAIQPKGPFVRIYAGGNSIYLSDGLDRTGISFIGSAVEKNIGEYECAFTLNSGYCWSESTQGNILREDRPFTWSIVAAGTTDPDHGGTTTPTDKTKTVTANLYLPGEKNQVLPGTTVYLNNSNNPIQGTGTPTTPKSNNARLKTAADGTKTLTLSITNPVFTLQAIGGCSNARIIDTKTSSNLVYQGGSTGKYSTRISEITVELLDDSGEYVFEDCTEFPTLLGTDWNYPLILAVNFDGGVDDSLDSKDNVDTSGIAGGNQTADEKPTAELKPAVTADKDGVASVEITKKDLDTALEEIGETGGTIVIAPEIEGTAAKVNVNLPKSSAEAMAKAGADLAVKTGVAGVSVPAEGLGEIVKSSGSTVTVSAEKVDDAVAVNISVGGKTVEEIKGGITVTVPAAKQSGNVLVLVGADGTETIVKKSVVDGDTVKAILNGSATVKVVNRSKTFSDTANHWAADSIAFASSHELFQGVNDSQFAPNLTMSRGMLATVLYRLEDATEKGGSVFADVAEDAWYADAVAWANEKGIVSGYGNGVFAPNDNITREQLVVMLYRYAQYLGMDTKASKNLKSYADADAVSSWAVDAMQWAAANGLISGRSDGTLAPGSNATRAEAAAILQRMVELIVK